MNVTSYSEGRMDSLRAASDRVVICLEKAEADLKAVEHRLEEEFQQTYAGRGVSKFSRSTPQRGAINLSSKLQQCDKDTYQSLDNYLSRIPSLAGKPSVHPAKAEKA